MKKKIFFIFFIFLISKNIFAQDIQNEIVVSASKLINNQLRGTSTHIITKEDIDKYPGESLAQIISRLPGVEFKTLYGTGFGAKETIDIRGFADTAKSNTLILLNGQKLSNIDLSFVDFTTIPLNSIQRVEVIKGNSASVLYGGNSSAGAINIITNQFPGVKDNAVISSTYGSYGQFETFVSGTKAFEDFSITGNSNYIVTDGYRRNNGLRQKNGNIEINGFFNENISYHLNIASDDQYLELPGDVPVNSYSAGALNGLDGFSIDPRSTDTPADFSTSRGVKTFFSSTYSPNKSFEFINDGSYRYNNSQAFFISSSSTLDTTMDVFSYNPKVKLNRNIFGKNLNIISGIDTNYTYYHSDRMGVDGTMTKQVYKMSDTSLGTYINTELDITKLDKLGLGIRYQGNWLKATDFVGPASGAFRTNNSDSLTFDPQYALHIGYERELKKFGVIFSRIGKSFRYPNVDERVGQNAYNLNHDFTMKSQTSEDFEIGHKISKKNYNISTSFYYMKLRNEIYYDAVDFINKNLEPSKRYGIESSVNLILNDTIDIVNSFTFAKSKLRRGTYKGKEIPGVPSTTNKTEFNFKLTDYANFYTSVYYKSSTRMINDTKNFQVKMPEYYLVNMGVKGKVYGFDYNLAANNVLNKSYYNYAVASASTYNAYNTYPLPEFNMLLKVSRKF